MRILHVVPSYYPAFRYGGPIHSVHNLNKELVRQGAEVTVYTTSADGPKDLDVPLGVPIDRDGVKVYYFKPGLFRAWFYSRALHRMLAETAKDFDLIHITSVFLFASTLGAYYARKNNKPYIVSPRGSLMIEPISRKNNLLKRLYISLVEKNNLRGATIHFTAQAEKEEYEELRFPARNSFVVPNGIDVGKFDIQTDPNLFRRRLDISPEKKVVLFLGRISWKKGFDTLIPAFKVVIEKNRFAVLVIAGGDDEGYKKNVQELISKLKLDDRIIFAGELAGDMKAAAFRESNVFVLPSYSENFGMAVIEAMCFELPVIIAEGVGISGDIARAKAGIVIKKDENELANAILDILLNEAKARDVGKSGRKFVQGEFAIEHVARKMLTAYNGIIKGFMRDE
ncbi:MAG: group 1 glycosyl transferase [Parcubacteria group bacterium LiPW_15]|nr:MAG: group 1 glycosyl transferase [Parcubacteria group bacterium LiPW_15]